MSDPFDDVRPIGQPPVADMSVPKIAASARNRWNERKPSTLGSSRGTDGTEATEPRRHRRKLKPTMTRNEVMGMAERMLRRAYVEAMGGTKESPVRAVDQKYAATKFGVAIDKWTMLSGRPPQADEVRSEEEREGMEELCRRLLGMPAP